MLQFRKQKARQANANQNYLNFIKKNHLLIQQSFNQQTLPKSMRQKGTSTLILKSSQEDSPPRRAIHDSLSQFNQHPNQHIQSPGHFTITPSSQLRPMPRPYQKLHQHNDQIAQHLLSQKHLQPHNSSPTQKAKDLLHHLNKSRSPNARVLELKDLKTNRYQSIHQSPVELNLKFPTIDRKKNTIDVDVVDRPVFLNELRQRIRQVERRREDGQGKEVFHARSEGTKDDQTQRNKMRQVLYGLLPSFQGLKKETDNKIRHASVNKATNVVRVSQPPIKDMLSQYLQQSIKTKSIPFSIKKPPINTFQGANQNSHSNQKDDHYNLQPQVFRRWQQEMMQRNAHSQFQNIDIKEDEKQQQKEEKQQQKQDQAVISPTKKPKKIQKGLKYDSQLSIYELKIRSYRDFVFMVNLAHRIYDPILLKDCSNFKPQDRYKYYMGKGNNYLLVKSLLKRRFWWVVEEDSNKANFVWTQLKINYFYQLQNKATPAQRHHKLEQQVPSPKKNKHKHSQKDKPVKAGIYKAPLPTNPHLKVLTNNDMKYYHDFLEQVTKPQKYTAFQKRLKHFPENFLRARQIQPCNQKVHNHLQYNYFIGNKKALFYNLKQYYQLLGRDVFKVIPLTYHVKQATGDPQYDAFSKQFKRLAKDKNNKNVWIVKPGQLSNRGQGITVIDQVYQLNNILKKKQKHSNGIIKTYIVQKYIQKPLLYKGRKFDIRHYMMISRLHGVMRAYWFGQGYIRTSSMDYNINDIGDQMIHLTNDAIQKHGQGYGKCEEGNKVSYSQFQRYMDGTVGQGKFSFSQMIYPKMREVALDAIKATYLQLDPNNTQHNFQIFGLDFMIDQNYDVWLIQVNTNPCLQLSSKLLARLIPTMLEHTLRLTLDVIFPPPSHYVNSQKYLAPDGLIDRLQFQLIFDQDRDGKAIQQLYKNAKGVEMGQVDQQDQTYQNDGKEIELDNQIE